MYIKIENIVGVQVDGYIFECTEFSWERIDNAKAGEQLQEDAQIGDYGFYVNAKDISLSLVLDDTTIFLERGDVYVMNVSGKTIDSFHT
jgi:hypothetical protein